MSNPNSILDWFKCEIRNHVCKFTKDLRSSEKQHLSKITSRLEQYRAADENAKDLVMEIDSLKREIREIEEARARKIIFRSRGNWSLYGERPTKYFLKQKNTESCLHSIVSDNGDTITDIRDILKESRTFYEQQYEAREDQQTPINLVKEMSRIEHPVLCHEYKESLDTPFSQAEFREALSKLNSGKSPGTDGLPQSSMLSSGNSWPRSCVQAFIYQSWKGNFQQASNVRSLRLFQ